MYELIPLRGLVVCFGKDVPSQEVDGFAYEIPDYEWAHVWVTPVIGELAFFLDWTVSQWETGMRFGRICQSTPQAAAEAGARLARQKGEKAVRAAIASALGHE